MQSDKFYTVKNESEAELKVKGSRFMGRAFNCSTIKACEAILTDLRKNYYDATHHCFAYRIGHGREALFRYSDDGEPNGTAGKPIFDRIEGLNLTDTLVVVTRYYGGTKLGTGGLTHAYSDAAGMALEKAGKLKCYLTGKLRLFLEFSDYNPVERLIQKYEGRIVKSDFGEKVALVVELRRSRLKKFTGKITDMTSGRAVCEEEA